MGRPKGGNNRKYTVEEKLKYVKMYLEDHIGTTRIMKLHGVSSSNIDRWVKAYMEHGEAGLKNKKKTGNRFAALTNSKPLTDKERLLLENAKLRIENERLKKGYMVKGVGAAKEYVITQDLNTKSSEN